MIKVPKLKLELWQELIYFVFIIVIPTIIAFIEVLNSHSSLFKITFASIGSILLVLIILKKFIFNDKINKLRERCILLEHDYSIEVGNKINIESQWGLFNTIIYGYNALMSLCALLLSVSFISALSKQLIVFRGAAIIILSSVMIGLIWKLILFMRRAYEHN